MAIIQSIDAGLTDLGRELRVRGETEGLVFGDWTFRVGTDGFGPGPTDITPVDFSQQALSAPLGNRRSLGRVLDSGAGTATVTVLSDGFVQVDGLSNIPVSIQNRWLTLSGSADPLINGTWVISEYNSATSVNVYNPLATADEATPIDWELRENCLIRPNDKAIDFYGRLPAPDAVTDLQELGQVGVFARVIRAPTEPSLVGLSFLFAVAHHPALAKFEELAINYHICVQV